jgi:hypothetical protein
VTGRELPALYSSSQGERVSTRTAALIVFVLATGLPSSAEACVCVGSPACEIASKVAAAFVGRVIDVQSDDSPGLPGRQIIRFAVEVTGRGISGSTVEIASDGSSSSCGARYDVGERYVIYAHSDQRGRLSTSLCGTRRVTHAKEDVEYLKTLASPARGVRIFGTVRRLEDSLESFDDNSWDRGAVAGARMRVTGANGTHERTTGRDGRYDFRGLPAGTYMVTMTPPKGLGLLGPPLPPEDHVPTSTTVKLEHPSECIELRHQVVTDSRIGGVLLRPDGRPAGNTFLEVISVANVNVNIDGATGGPMFPRVRVRTDADGRYTFAFIPAGRYVLGPILSEVRPHNRYYHPGVTEPSRATVITVKPGSRIELPPFRLLEWSWPD